MRVRSVVASATFVGFGMITATLLRSSQYFPVFTNSFTIENGLTIGGFTLLTGLLTTVFGYTFFGDDHSSYFSKMYTCFAEVIYGTSFAVALTVANMIKPSATLAFLDLNSWNPVLVLVLG